MFIRDRNLLSEKTQRALAAEARRRNAVERERNQLIRPPTQVDGQRGINRYESNFSRTLRQEHHPLALEDGAGHGVAANEITGYAPRSLVLKADFTFTAITADGKQDHGRWELQLRPGFTVLLRPASLQGGEVCFAIELKAGLNTTSPRAPQLFRLSGPTMGVTLAQQLVGAYEHTAPKGFEGLALIGRPSTPPLGNDSTSAVSWG
jgi:hypothetical protein